MTGSGACVFCGFSGESEADAVLESLPAIWTGWKAKALTQHPLFKMLQM
jgi:4-diphosphocytidyl-2-C-methyl-D-erythritol kinase